MDPFVQKSLETVVGVLVSALIGFFTYIIKKSTKEKIIIVPCKKDKRNKITYGVVEIIFKVDTKPIKLIPRNSSFFIESSEYIPKMVLSLQGEPIHIHNIKKDEVLKIEKLFTYTSGPEEYFVDLIDIKSNKLLKTITFKS